MARRPTGRPPGRPPKYVADLKLDPQKAKAMRDALEFFNKAQLTLSESELERIRRMEAPVETGAREVDRWDDVKVPSDTMVPLKDLVPLTEEELKKASAQARGILGAVVAGFHHRVPELLARLATWEPEKALKLYIELMEYQTPKLQRVEQTGGVDHRHQVFVPVEQRDRDPRVIDARVIEREEDPSEPAPVPVREQRDADDAAPGNGGAGPVHAEAAAVPAVEPEAVPPWEDASDASSGGA